MICDNCLKASVCKHREECQRIEEEHTDNQFTIRPYSLKMTCMEKVNSYDSGGLSTRGWINTQTIQTPYQITTTASPETIENVSRSIAKDMKLESNLRC